MELLHSATPRNVKEYVTSQLSAATNHLRVLIATIAYGMGVNRQGLSRVIHFGPPKSVQADLQESGRCGRGGEQSDAILLYNGIDLKLSDAGMKEYVKADSCRRKLLLKHFDIPHPANLPIGDNCCDSCSQRHLPLPSEELLLAKNTTDERVETLTVSAECHVIDLVYCACFSPSVSFHFINSIGCSSYITRLALASVLGLFGTFAEIHSTHPGALMHYSQFQSPVVNPDSSPPVRSPVDVYRPWENTRDLPVFIL